MYFVIHDGLSRDSAERVVERLMHGFAGQSHVTAPDEGDYIIYLQDDTAAEALGALLRQKHAKFQTISDADWAAGNFEIREHARRARAFIEDLQALVGRGAS